MNGTPRPLADDTENPIPAKVPAGGGKGVSFELSVSIVSDELNVQFCDFERYSRSKLRFYR